jgi:hypothetical protein
MLDKLVFADARKKKIIGEAPLASPRAPVFDSKGRLYVLSEGKVKRFRVTPGRPGLAGASTVVDHDLEEPHRLAVDDRGNLYVSDRGKAHQVKVFDPRGRLLRKIGKAGGPQTGLYDERRMSHPCGVTIDGPGQVWVAEGEMPPKRLSVWKADGAFVKALYGPTKYGGAALDPRDKTRLYYEENGRGIEFALDWETGASGVKSVYWRPDQMTDVEVMPGPAPERAFHVGGYRYLVNCDNGGLRENTTGAPAASPARSD